MTVIIRDAETDKMIRRRAALEGVGLTTVVKRAMQAYEANEPVDDKEERFRRIDAILAEFDQQPILDPRSAKELMDDLYDEDGLPK